MKAKPSLPLLLAPLALISSGCSGEAEPTAQDKKNFMGAPMPADFAAKNGMAGGPAAAGQAQGEEIARKAAAEAAAAAAKQGR